MLGDDINHALNLGEHPVAVMLGVLGDQLGKCGRVGETVDGSGPHLDVAALFDDGAADLADVIPAVFNRVSRGTEQLQQLLDAAFGQSLAKEQAARNGIGADDVSLLVRLVPIGQEHRQLDERVDPTIELGPVEIVPAQYALDDLRSGQSTFDFALAERTDDGVGIAQQRGVVDDCPAVGRERCRHRAKTARRRVAPPLALADEVELIVLHGCEHTQGVWQP